MIFPRSVSEGCALGPTLALVKSALACCEHIAAEDATWDCSFTSRGAAKRGASSRLAENGALVEDVIDVLRRQVRPEGVHRAAVTFGCRSSSELSRARVSLGKMHKRPNSRRPASRTNNPRCPLPHKMGWRWPSWVLLRHGVGDCEEPVIMQDELLGHEAGHRRCEGRGHGEGEHVASNYRGGGGLAVVVRWRARIALHLWRVSSSTSRR